MKNQITNMAGTTYKVGMKVKHTDGWNGTIVGIKGSDLLVNPDNLNEVPEWYCWKLNSEAAKRAGKAEYCEPRDSGQSMGNFKRVLFK